MSPLEDWVAARLGGPLDPATLPGRQLALLRRTVALAKAESPFYRRLLADVDPESIRDLSDLARLPLTRPEDLRDRPEDLLCRSRAEIERVVTLATSGATGEPKRLFFTTPDIEATLDFFHQGMTTFVSSGEAALILMPGGDRPGGVGALLTEALARFGARGLVQDPAAPAGDILRRMAAEGIAALVAPPVPALALARAAARRGRPPGLRTALLSADLAVPALIGEIKRHLCPRVAIHWGMTETGYGGAVDCLAGQGCHIRAADLLIEILDPRTGAHLPDGRTGQIVVSTLSRTGMPLVRYATGDLASLERSPCACGATLPRLTGFRGRMVDHLRFEGGAVLSLFDLDQAFFPLPGVLDVAAAVRPGPGGYLLDLAARLDGPAGAEALAAIRQAALDLLARKGLALADAPPGPVTAGPDASASSTAAPVTAGSGDSASSTTGPDETGSDGIGPGEAGLDQTGANASGTSPANTDGRPAWRTRVRVAPGPAPASGWPAKRKLRIITEDIGP